MINHWVIGYTIFRQTHLMLSPVLLLDYSLSAFKKNTTYCSDVNHHIVSNSNLKKLVLIWLDFYFLGAAIFNQARRADDFKESRVTVLPEMIAVMSCVVHTTRKVLYLIHWLVVWNMIFFPFS